MSSRNLYNQLRRHAIASGIVGHWCRMENVAGVGQPDVNVALWWPLWGQGREVWIELKFKKFLPARKSTPVFSGSYGLRPEQMIWFHERDKVGQLKQVWIFCRAGDQIWLIEGSHWRSFNELTTNDLQTMARWSLLRDGKDSWPRLFSCLLDQ